MSQTEAERRAYARGYARGRARNSDWAMKLLDMLKAYRARLTDRISQRRCGACERWVRGGPGCKWGRCKMAGDTSAWIAEPGAWPDDSQKRDRDLITHEHFGCTNWLPRIRRERA